MRRPAVSIRRFARARPTLQGNLGRASAQVDMTNEGAVLADATCFLALQPQLAGSARTPTLSRRERELSPFPRDGGRLGLS